MPKKEALKRLEECEEYVLITAVRSKTKTDDVKYAFTRNICMNELTATYLLHRVLNEVTNTKLEEIKVID